MMNSSLTEPRPPPNVTDVLRTATQRYTTKLARQVRNGAPCALLRLATLNVAAKHLNLVAEARALENHGSAKSLTS